METSRTGDQGADVIAEKNGKKIIVQCKLYSKPVGNKAVQEVFAAKQFYNGDLGIVITNNDYTKSARQLANSTNILTNDLLRRKIHKIFNRKNLI